MFVRTIDNGIIDISPAEAEVNSNLPVLLAPYRNLGNDVQEDKLVAYRSASNTNLQLGSWYKVPDASLQVFSRSYFEKAVVIWNLPNGSSIELTENEVRGQVPWVHFGSSYGISNAFVKLNLKTQAGFRAFGMLNDISQDEIDKAIERDKENKERDTPTTGEVIQTGARSLVILAILGAAIYFLPKNILRG